MTQTLPDLQLPIERIVADRNAALAKFAEATELLSSAHAAREGASAILARASFGRRHHDRRDDRTRQLKAFELPYGYDAEKARDAFRQELDASIWDGLADRLNFLNLMDADDKEAWRASLEESAPEVTEENIEATLAGLLTDSRLIFQRGLARTFSSLDRRFKSHDVFKFGARIILTHFLNDMGFISYGNRAHDTLVDIERAFATLDGQGPEPRALSDAIQEQRAGGISGPRQGEVETRYFRVRTFKNGNAHLWFTRKDLVEKVNQELAAYYGEVIPDAAERGEELKPGTALAKDLQFYPTPDEVIMNLLRDHDFRDLRVLEPSAGEGAIVRELHAHRAAQITAVEVDASRAARIPSLSGVEIIRANFLDLKPRAEFDWVIMNPPFYGTHWMDHVLRAFDWLKPGGRLIAILPATAEIGESAKHQKFRAWAEKNAPRFERMFSDLPPESFKASGTRIQTVALRLTRSQTLKGPLHGKRIPRTTSPD
ncbi:DUF4942 domain-containing protein [Thalassovita mediterranea]|nr:DUF4942 domain-containing protein [Thalassovita mediterranea]